MGEGVFRVQNTSYEGTLTQFVFLDSFCGPLPQGERTQQQPSSLQRDQLAIVLKFLAMCSAPRNVTAMIALVGFTAPEVGNRLEPAT